MTGSLDGQCAVVTGGSQGLGLAIAHRLLADGARVVIWDRDREALASIAAQNKAPDRLQTVVVDVTSPAQVEAAAAATYEVQKSVSILVNNAGIAGPQASAWNLAPEDWDRVISVNLTSVFLCSRAIVPGMMATGYGRIVNIASVAGKEASPSICAYAAAKAGVINFTKTLGRELAETGITVNCITPAAIRTALLESWPPDMIATLLGKIPMKRFGLPSELAAMVAWVASPEASFSTGATFDLTGGRADY